MTDPKNRVRKAPAKPAEAPKKAPVDPVVAAEATAPVLADPPDSSYPSSGPLEAGGPSNVELERLAGGGHHNPHSILGIHPVDKGVVLRALRPGAERVSVLDRGVSERNGGRDRRR